MATETTERERVMVLDRIFDENDRVSMRGTNPSLTQTLINGHNVAAGDWFVLDQTGTVGRSVSYTLLPSELVSQVDLAARGSYRHHGSVQWLRHISYRNLFTSPK